MYSLRTLYIQAPLPRKIQHIKLRQSSWIKGTLSRKILDQCTISLSNGCLMAFTFAIHSVSNRNPCLLPTSFSYSVLFAVALGNYCHLELKLLLSAPSILSHPSTRIACGSLANSEKSATRAARSSVNSWFTSCYSAIISTSTAFPFLGKGKVFEGYSIYN